MFFNKLKIYYCFFLLVSNKNDLIKFLSYKLVNKNRNVFLARNNRVIITSHSQFSLPCSGQGETLILVARIDQIISDLLARHTTDYATVLTVIEVIIWYRSTLIMNVIL